MHPYVNAVIEFEKDPYLPDINILELLCVLHEEMFLKNKEEIVDNFFMGE